MAGNDKVTIFTMNKHITPHLIEAVDKANFNYVDYSNGEHDHEEADNEDEKVRIKLEDAEEGDDHDVDEDEQQEEDDNNNDDDNNMTDEEEE